MGVSLTRARPVIRFGVFELDQQAGELRKNGAKVRVEGQPLTILALLLERAGEVVTREEVRAKLWPAQTFVDFEHSINVAIKRLREALDDSAETPRFVETLPRRGYRFIYPVNRAAAPVPAAAPRHSSHVVAAVVVTGVIVGLVAFGTRLFQYWKPNATPQIRSLAVLPLKNLSQDPEQEYFADGVTDAVITELGKIGALRVISLQSVLRYKGIRKPLPEIARELKVQAVVEGSVLRSGGQVRINAQLMQAEPEAHLWAESFAGSESDVLRLQDEVATAISQAIRIAVTPQQRAHLVSDKGVNPEAYRAYLRGRELYRRFDDEWFDSAIEYLQQAIRIDPTYAPAYATMAEIYSTDMRYSYQELNERATSAAAKAVGLDDNLAEAHAAQAYVNLRFRWDWPGAEREIKRAIELNPNSSEALQMYGYYLALMGRFDESIASYRRAIELDPLNFLPNERLGFAYTKAGRYDDAIAHLRELGRLDPEKFMAHYTLAHAYAFKKMCREAMEEVRKGQRHLGHVAQPANFDYGFVIAACGNRKEAEDLIQTMIAYSRRRYLDPTYIAVTYSGLGEKQKAIDWLERGYQQRARFLIYLKTLHQVDPLRSDPRFQDLLRHMNFPR